MGSGFLADRPLLHKLTGCLIRYRAGFLRLKTMVNQRLRTFFPNQGNLLTSAWPCIYGIMIRIAHYIGLISISDCTLTYIQVYSLGSYIKDI